MTDPTKKQLAENENEKLTEATHHATMPQQEWLLRKREELEGMSKRELWHTVLESVNYNNYYRNSLESPPKNMKSLCQTGTYILILSATPLKIDKKLEQLKSLLADKWISKCVHR